MGDTTCVLNARCGCALSCAHTPPTGALACGVAAQALSLPDGDVLLHAGDFTRRGTEREVRAFAEWLARQPHRLKVVIAGNHDLSFDACFPKRDLVHQYGFPKGTNDQALAAIRGLLAGPDAPCVYLEGQSVEVDGWRIWGAPHTPAFWGAFNVEPGPSMEALWGRIPAGTDIVVTHGPALGHGDTVARGRQQVGCPTLRRHLLQRVRPAIHVCGHIHESAGVSFEGGICFANVATCDLSYRATQPAAVFQLRRRAGDAAIAGEPCSTTDISWVQLPRSDHFAGLSDAHREEQQH